MLESEDVDEEYFTPIVSSTLANIFKDEASIDQTVNATLKYKPPQPNKPELIPKPANFKQNDSNLPECIFSCSLIAYEWLDGAHKCKGKVGFAIMRTINTEVIKMILYSPDKSTLSCTTMSPQLEVTLKGAMISFYDDRWKYWSLCFNDKIIGKVTNLMRTENVIIKHYENPQFSNSASTKSELESLGSDETIDEPDNNNIIEVNATTLKNAKASILSRIANVGQAILPPGPSSPVKKPAVLEKLSSTESYNSNEKAHLSETESNSEAPAMHDPTKSIIVQAFEGDPDIGLNDTECVNNCKPFKNMSTTKNSQVLNSNGVQMHKPVSNKIESSNNAVCMCVDLEVMLTKLSHLQSLVKNMELIIRNTHTNETETKVTSCKSDTSAKILNQLENNLTDIILEVQNKQTLRKLTELEELMKEKNDVILKIETELKQEIKKTSDLIAEQNRNTIYIKEQIEGLKHDLTIKNEEMNSLKIKSEADIIVARTVKKVMNDTYHSLASNFEDEASYSGNDIKNTLMIAIKKSTIESLSNLTSTHDI